MTSAVDRQRQLGHDAQLARACGIDGLPPFSRAFYSDARTPQCDELTTPLVMPRAMMSLVAGAVHGQRFAAQREQLGLGEQLGQQIEHVAATTRGQQRLEGTPERV